MYNEHWGGIGLLTNEQRGVLLQALMAYNGANCKMPEMDQATACIFAMIQPRGRVTTPDGNDPRGRRRKTS